MRFILTLLFMAIFCASGFLLIELLAVPIVLLITWIYKNQV
jgi:hypothetical protein